MDQEATDVRTDFRTLRALHRLFTKPGVLALAMVTAGTTAMFVGEPAEAAPRTGRFGSGIDGYQPYVGQSTCDATAKPGVVDFMNLVLATYPETSSSGIIRGCNVGDRSEHKEGRAWDWHVSSVTQRHIADDLINWLLATDQYGNAHAMARRLGIMYIIWDARMWRAYDPFAGFQPISCSGTTDCHQDHVHFSFGWPGALRQTTWWTAQRPIGKTTVGYYQPSTAGFHVRNALAGGPDDAAFGYGPANMIPIAGDWNADGKATVGYYQPSNGTFHLRNSLDGGGDDAVFAYGPPNMVPIAGDWNNDGKTTVGYYQPSNGTFHLRNTPNAGPDDAAFAYGPPNMKPITGDWNNDGKTTVGYYQGSTATFHVRDTLNNGPDDAAFAYGPANMVPITGDWNADGKTTVGYYQPANGSFHVRNILNSGPDDASFVYGPANMRPITGDWNRS